MRNELNEVVEDTYIQPIEIDETSTKVYRFFKRLFDIVSSTCALVLLGWLLLLVSVIIKLTSKGAVFFLDHRVGINGKDIYVLKFRTMFADAEENIRKYLNDEQYKAWEKERKVEDDPRVTSVGRFLRKTSIDELPQLVNILKGDLSVVGPRPLTRYEIEENFSLADQKTLLSVKPGLTGNWGAYGRSAVTYESGERQRLELEYVDKRSTLFDLKLIFATVGSVLRGKGAQ